MDSAKPPAGLTREQRLAVQLRTNLRRRKHQARALGLDQSVDATAKPVDNLALVKPSGDG